MNWVYVKETGLRQFQNILIGAYILFTFAFVLSLLTYHPDDPSLNTANSQVIDPYIYNMLGHFGSYMSDFAYQYFGATSYLWIPFLLSWSWNLFKRSQDDDMFIARRFHKYRLLGFIISTILICMLFNFLPFSLVPHHILKGGIIGFVCYEELVFQLDKLMFLSYAKPVILGFLIFLAISLFIYSSGLRLRYWLAFISFGLSQVFYYVIQPLITQIHSLFERKNRAIDIYQEYDQEPETEPSSFMPIQPSFTSDLPSEKRSPSFTDIIKSKAKSAVSSKPKTRSTSRKEEERDFMSNYGDFELPSLDYLKSPPKTASKQVFSPEYLQSEAREIEGVLSDFGVHGAIQNISPGPVITLYEFEPAPGTKSAKVIGLSDDIARTIGAISVRISVVPGQNALGIELPNDKRETVYLRELLESAAYQNQNYQLGLVLGKNIAGHPIIADLARMPHLLIAGTTGSGKSVGINTMILSLLYRHSPDKCRFIMIDPKMLELSVYEGIPHLLTPVVTDPRKAILALKWTVREMEERYRSMSKLGVRNIDGYNARIKEAQKNNEIITKRVQTGFDPDTGKPIFEEQPIPLTELPFIVVIVDEMADLMLVAGKEIEAAIQRLAQMARAAGIHIIMATQRPSVDVITGTIKANFPTRISFHVTSKIDSRTILSEQGAEQLLGQGDLLYTAGGGRLIRVHGPFVSDQEVEEIVKHLKAQGEPSYEVSITEDASEGMMGAEGTGAGSFMDNLFGAPDQGSSGNSEERLYQQAVMLIKKEKKASTSFIQRHFRLGYNRAASLIDRMEREGIISAANHVGKREVIGDES